MHQVFFPHARPRVLIRGAGELASGVAVRLFRCGFPIVMSETDEPLAIRRTVCFSEAVYERRAVVEGCEARLVAAPEEVAVVWSAGAMAVIVDPNLASLDALLPDVLVDATLAKRNMGVHMGLADLVVALGPGFEAGRDAHVVVETMRGHDLGRLLYSGFALPNTGVPGELGGQTALRVLRTPADGVFEAERQIGDVVAQGETVGHVAGKPVTSALAGALRGLIRPGIRVWKGLKIGDVDPRMDPDYCNRVSDKARALGGAVLEAILSHDHGRGMRAGTPE